MRVRGCRWVERAEEAQVAARWCNVLGWLCSFPSLAAGSPSSRASLLPVDVPGRILRDKLT